MEDVPTTTSFLRNRAGNRTIDDSSTSIQHLNIPEPPQFFYGTCTRPLAELSRTTLVQMRVNEMTTGFYLLLRTLAPTVTGTMNNDFGRNALVLVEDHMKRRIYCCLFGHVHLRSDPELKELLPVNTVLALKEPLVIACSEQQFVVAVGGPSDLVVVGRSHDLYKDAEALGWREKVKEQGIQLTRKWSRIGDDLFQKRKFYDASDAYLFALSNCSDIHTKLLLNQNLAGSFLAQGCYEPAIRHALKVLEIDPFNEMALYCASRAHYELREYSKARIGFDTLKLVFPSNKNYLAELVRCEDRLREADGNVDIFKLYLATLTDVTTLIDHGSFWRNIEFRPGPGNVRGVFATQDMEPGTLILVEKAVVTAFEPSCSTEHELVNFIRAIFRAVMKNPKTLGRKLHYLPGGYSITDNNQRMFCDEVNELEPLVDVCRLYHIIHKNFVKAVNIMVENAPFTYLLYEAASRFRYSCLSNCSYLSYKDVVTLRTCTSVVKGEELFVRYYGNHLSFPEKQQAFERSGFACSCFLCTLDKMESTTVHDLRKRLKTTFDAEMALGAAEERLLPIVQELQLTYRNRHSVRLLLFMVYRDLAKVVDRRREDWTDKVTLYVERGLQSVGLSIAFLLNCAKQVNPQIPHFILMPAVLSDFAGLMAEKEYHSGRLDLVEKWIKVILLVERIYSGGNIEMITQRFSDFKDVPSLLLAFA